MCFLSERHRHKREVQFSSVGCYWEAAYYRKKSDTSAKLQVSDVSNNLTVKGGSWRFLWVTYSSFMINWGNTDFSQEECRNRLLSKHLERDECIKVENEPSGVQKPESTLKIYDS